MARLPNSEKEEDRKIKMWIRADHRSLLPHIEKITMITPVEHLYGLTVFIPRERVREYLDAGFIVDDSEEVIEKEEIEEEEEDGWFT